MATAISTAKFLVNKADVVFIELPPGKPDRTSPFASIAEDRRPRVKQNGQGPGECWKFAANYIRVRYGPSSAPEFKEKRHFEKSISTHVRNLAKLIDFYNKAEDLLNFLKEENTPSSSTVEIPDNPSLAAFAQSYLQQTEELEIKQFVDKAKAKARMDLELSFLSLLQIDPQDEYRSYQAISSYKTPTWEKINTLSRQKVIATITLRVCYRKYELAESSWHPAQTIAQFIQELTKSPLLVVGPFGKSFYKNAPFNLVDLFHGKEVWGWKPTDERQSQPENHVVVIVGAKMEADKLTGRVFFFDPNSAHGPKEHPPLFTMSYKRLAAEVENTWREFMRTPTEKGYLIENSRSEKLSYAYYSPYIAAQLKQ